MKRIFLLLILCAGAAGLTGCMGGIELLNFGGHKAPTIEPTKNGRYQLAVTPQGALVKMDTVTGEVWSARVTGNALERWEKAPN